MQDPPPPPQTPKPDHDPSGLGRGQPPQPPPPQISPPHSHLTPHTSLTVSGRLLLAGSALGCVVLFFIVWGSIRLVEQHVRDSRPVLTWADRANWFAPSVIQTTLVKPNATNVQYTYNKPRYRDPGLVIPPQEEQVVLALAQLAGGSAFTDDLTREQLEQLTAPPSSNHPSPITDHTSAPAPPEPASADVSPNNFYAHYLLGTWHQRQGNTQLADNHYQQAITNAPRIIVIRYTDAQGNPVANLKLDRIEIGCDRVTNEGTTLDQRLVLVYPHLTTDLTGRVYLPVYDTTYRPVYLPQPQGYKITYAPAEGWFKLPTRLGTIQAHVTSVH